MPNNNFINLLTKLSEALISGGKKNEKAGYKPVNAYFAYKMPNVIRLLFAVVCYGKLWVIMANCVPVAA